MFLHFKTYCGYQEDDGNVYINPEYVAAVNEEVRNDEKLKNVAVIELVTGTKHVVYDLSRDVARQLGEPIYWCESRDTPAL